MVVLPFNFRPFRLRAADAGNSLDHKASPPASWVIEGPRKICCSNHIVLGSLHLIGGQDD